jgi:hypothetical protein
MAKIEKKSIAELVASRSRRPSPEEIDVITQQIHTPPVVATPIEPVAPIATPITKEELRKEQIIPLEDILQTKRISVNATIPLYLKAKTRATLQGKTLMAYIITLMENDVRNM